MFGLRSDLIILRFDLTGYFGPKDFLLKSGFEIIKSVCEIAQKDISYFKDLALDLGKEIQEEALSNKSFLRCDPKGFKDLELPSGSVQETAWRAMSIIGIVDVFFWKKKNIEVICRYSIFSFVCNGIKG